MVWDFEPERIGGRISRGAVEAGQAIPAVRPDDIVACDENSDLE
jgi:hypothetical protein